MSAEKNVLQSVNILSSYRSVGPLRLLGSGVEESPMVRQPNITSAKQKQIRKVYLVYTQEVSQDRRLEQRAQPISLFLFRKKKFA